MVTANHFLFVYAKVCSDESTVTCSYICNGRFSSVESQHFDDHYSAGIFLIEAKEASVKNEEEKEKQQEGKMIIC